MKPFFCLTLLGVFGLSLACDSQRAVESPPSMPAPIPENQFDGVWEFVQLVTPDGPSTTQRGHMVVTSDYVCFVRVNKERNPIATDDPDDVKSEKAADLYNAVRATCGTFSIEGDSLKAHWLTSADPSVEGNFTDFILTREADTISLAPAAASQYKFVYRRVR